MNPASLFTYLEDIFSYELIYHLLYHLNVKFLLGIPKFASLRLRNNITIIQTLHIMLKYARAVTIMLRKDYIEKRWYHRPLWMILRKRLLHSFRRMSDSPYYIYMMSSVWSLVLPKKIAEEFYMVSSITKKTIYSY